MEQNPLVWSSPGSTRTCGATRVHGELARRFVLWASLMCRERQQPPALAGASGGCSCSILYPCDCEG